jgi:hypothetical protein
MKILYSLLFFLLLLVSISCNKDQDYQIRYDVNCNGECEVDYAMSGGLTQTENISGVWSKEWKGKEGQQIYLKAGLTSQSGNFTAEVKIDGEAFDQVVSNTMNEPLTISGKVPG